ncbi:MAG: hypothetical protein H7A25_10150 [Leptospiraceae bacterium]|nr:hypothetical protein [Leptospiraceae bacterium]MCP5500253.1 hypothetical protein [Leptospiraceae bacterium]
MDEWKAILQKNFASILIGFFTSLVIISGMITYSLVNMNHPPEVILIKECYKLCERDVEVFKIDGKTGKPYCKCKSGIIRTTLEKLLNDNKE